MNVQPSRVRWSYLSLLDGLISSNESRRFAEGVSLTRLDAVVSTMFWLGVISSSPANERSLTLILYHAKASMAAIITSAPRPPPTAPAMGNDEDEGVEVDVIVPEGLIDPNGDVDGGDMVATVGGVRDVNVSVG